jgi:hypothetical protein
MQPRLKAAFLLRAYEETEAEQAQRHLQALDHDPHSFLYDAANPEHLERLHTAARQPFGYKVYYAGRKEIEWKPPPAYREKMRNYILREHPFWRDREKGEKIRIGLSEEFGVLFLTFNVGVEEDKIELSTLEKNY